MITDQQYLKIADEAFDEALETVRSSDGWKVEKEDKENNVLVEMKKNKTGKKIYRCKVSIKWSSKWIFVMIVARGPHQDACQAADREYPGHRQHL